MGPHMPASYLMTSRNFVKDDGAAAKYKVFRRFLTKLVAALKIAFPAGLCLLVTACGGTSDAAKPSPPGKQSHQVLSIDSPAGTAWIWKSGSQSGDAASVYGTEGVAAPGNTPGARYAPVSWTDASGNFWLFGGWDGQGMYNDMWEYNPITGEWAWMGGTSTQNAPGVYGTQGQADAGDIPGARTEAALWRDAAGDVWLFGGQGYDSTGTWGVLNDLWEYSPANGMWTWVSGSNTGSNPAQSSSPPLNGVYGTLGTGAAGNGPGARTSANLWTDAAGKVWLFGGDGYGPSGNNVDVLN